MTKSLEYCNKVGIKVPPPIPVENGNYVYSFDLAMFTPEQFEEFKKIWNEE